MEPEGHATRKAPAMTPLRERIGGGNSSRNGSLFGNLAAYHVNYNNSEDEATADVSLMHFAERRGQHSETNFIKLVGGPLPCLCMVVKRVLKPRTLAGVLISSWEVT